MQRMLETKAEGIDASNARQSLLRELNSMENGPLAELEKSATERKRTSVEASLTLQKNEASATEARLELERRDAATRTSKDELSAIQQRTVKVGLGKACDMHYALN